MRRPQVQALPGAYVNLILFVSFSFLVLVVALVNNEEAFFLLSRHRSTLYPVWMAAVSLGSVAYYMAWPSSEW